MQLTTWIPLRYWRIWGGGNFIDSGQILQWAECYKKLGTAIFASQGECSGYLYGSSLIRILNALDLTSNNTQVLGYVFMLGLAFAISFTAGFSSEYKENLPKLAIVFSPPILLLAERGNFDVLMLLLVICSSVLFSRNYQIWALVPLAISVLLKFYTLPLFLLYIVLNDTKRRKLITLLVFALVSFRVALDLKLIQSRFPSGYSWKFGASIWPRYISQLNVPSYGELVNHLAGFAILITIFLITVSVMKKTDTLNSAVVLGERNERNLFYALFGAHLSCYMLGMNFDYRLVFLLLASVIYLNTFHTLKFSNSNLLLVLTLVSAWLSYPSSGLEPIGDLAIEVLTVILGIRFFQLIRIDASSRRAK